MHRTAPIEAVEVHTFTVPTDGPDGAAPSQPQRRDRGCGARVFGQDAAAAGERHWAMFKALCRERMRAETW